MRELRTALSGDAEGIALIEKECFNDPWSKESILDEINYDDSLFIVLLMDSKVIGYGGLRKIFDEGHIMNIAISKKHQKKGLGTKLLESLMKRGRKLGITQFTLEVRAQNEKAIKMYERFGFVIVGTRKDYYSHPVEDAIIMWNRL